jgi:hypothetical protein
MLSAYPQWADEDFRRSMGCARAPFRAITGEAKFPERFVR